MLTLAVSIGATSVVFSALDIVILKPLPYPDADRLVSVFETSARAQQATRLVAAVRIEEWNRLTRILRGAGRELFRESDRHDRTGPGTCGRDAHVAKVLLGSRDTGGAGAHLHHR